MSSSFFEEKSSSPSFLLSSMAFEGGLEGTLKLYVRNAQTAEALLAFIAHCLEEVGMSEHPLPTCRYQREEKAVCITGHRKWLSYVFSVLSQELSDLAPSSAVDSMLSQLASRDVSSKKFDSEAFSKGPL